MSGNLSGVAKVNTEAPLRELARRVGGVDGIMFESYSLSSPELPLSSTLCSAIFIYTPVGYDESAGGWVVCAGPKPRFLGRGRIFAHLIAH